MKKFKNVDFQVLEKADNGGRILISNASFDRDADRVFPMGGQLDSYLKNPVVQWGHGYSEPWQTVGRTTGIEITPEGIVASFELRPAANDQDPQNIVKLLWDGGWIRTASIGFIPKAAQPNQAGGNDFTQWELLEWSLVPIPANQDALRMSMKALEDNKPEIVVDQDTGVYTINNAHVKFIDVIEQKRGRVLSSSNETKLRIAYESIGAVLAQIAQEPEQNAPEQQPEVKDALTPEQEQVLAAELGNMLKAVKTIIQ